MKKTVGYQYENATGLWTILWRKGRWWVSWNDEDLDHFASLPAALDDLVGGHTPWPSSGLDPSECGLPDDLSDWSALRARK